ncbi:MAG: RpiB/LacA/LacB family sugar-phosphate isomerase, partial [Thermoleophilia bacterium]
HEVELFGPLAGGDEEWVAASAAVGRAVAAGHAERGVVCCWSGTGASIAANKVPGVRAALCTDAETARMARRYNDANVLALSLRLTSPAMGREILEAFLAAPAGDEPFDRRNLEQLAAMEGDG